MTGTRDMTAANWKRTVGRLRRMAAELALFDFQVIEPANLDTPPPRRGVDVTMRRGL